MSSLLQSPGRSTAGKHEIFVYLVHYAEKPVRCMECGHPWEGQDRCQKCGRFVLLARKYERPHQKPDEAKELLSVGAAMLKPDYEAFCKEHKANSIGTTSCCNSFEMHDSEPVVLPHPRKGTSTVQKLYRVWRKPVDMCGHFVGFKISGEKTYPDLSCPTWLEKLPRDAEPLTNEEAAKYWFS